MRPLDHQALKAHNVLDVLGVPSTSADGTSLPLEARLVRYARKHEMLCLPVDIPAVEWCTGTAFAVPGLCGRA